MITLFILPQQNWTQVYDHCIEFWKHCISYLHITWERITLQFWYTTIIWAKNIPKLEISYQIITMLILLIWVGKSDSILMAGLCYFLLCLLHPVYWEGSYNYLKWVFFLAWKMHDDMHILFLYNFYLHDSRLIPLIHRTKSWFIHLNIKFTPYLFNLLYVRTWAESIVHIYTIFKAWCTRLLWHYL